MKLTIPTDQQLGRQLESIARTAAVIIAFLYAAGFTLGQAVHWLSANLTTLHHLLLHDEPAQASHPAANPSDSLRSGDYRSRSSKSAPRGFA
jgi:hypothetical protein